MPTTTSQVNGYYWNYTITGTSPNRASLGTGSGPGNATTATTGISGAITIPDSLDGYTVTAISTSAFQNCTNLTSVAIPSSVTSIGDTCFTKCSNLATAALPTALTYLGMYSFAECFKLTSVTIPNSVTTISVNTFEYCGSLTSVTIGTSVTAIGSYAFNYCNNINFMSVTIPNSVMSISFNAFSNCSGLTSVTIGTSVTSIGTDCFRYCTRLTSINIPASVTTINTNAFANTSSSLTVTIKQQQTINGNLTYFIGTSQFFFGNNSVDFVLPPPSITITSTTAGVTSGSTTNNTTIALRFTSSASTSDFVVGDISLNNGSLNSSFAGSGTVYNAIFTPNGQGVCTINVPANVFTAGGLNNAASNTFTFTFDAAPSMTITSTIASGSTSNIASIPLTFTATETITGFQEGDISFNKGSLSSFDGSGSVYTAMFTQGGEGVHIINVPVNAYIDASGNSNTVASSFNWTYDSVLPTMEISSTTLGVTSGSTTKNETIALKFTSSKPTNNFIKEDISFNKGSLTGFDGSGTVYTATFTQGGQGAHTINVPADAYIDAVGNNNAASNIFTWTFDNVSPSMDISSTTLGVTHGSTTNIIPIELRFTSTEATNNFGEGDISFTNGTLSNFASSSPTVYTATFTPTGPGPVACTIDVLAGAYTDAATNLNNLATQFAFTYDSVPPTMDITANVANNATTNNATIELTFTSSKPTTNFIKEDITVNNGTLSTPLTYISDTVYKAIFTPTGQGACTISVAANKFTDAAGNGNTASSTFTWTFDSFSPNMDIISTSGVASGSTTNVTPIELRFTSTEATNNFGEGGISVTNGTLSNFASSSPTVYTATFTPTGPGPVACTIDVLAGAYTDAATNLNNLATQFTFTYDSVRPTMEISSNVTSGSMTNISPIELTFTSSKPTNNFLVGDISLTNGTLASSFTAISATVYNAVFTPIGSGPVECEINVPAGAFTDAAGNGNTAATQYAFTFDSVPPTMDISSNVTSGSITNISPIELTFTSSEPITGFTRDDISFNKGTLSDTLNAISDTVYKAIFTPDEQGVYTIYVPAGTFTDAATNLNNLATQFTFTFDSVPPTMDISSNVTSGSTTNNASIALTFISSKATTDFDETNIRVSNGTLSSLTTSDNKVYNAIFTRINTITEGQCTIDVDAGAYTDAAGNNNIAATTFIWNFDSVSPNITITATAGPSNIEIATGATTNRTPILLTFTSTEATTNFEYADISVTNGELGTLTTSDNMVYYATFTPDESGVTGKTECSISVPADKFTDAVGNSNTASNTFTFTFDNTKPTITIESTTVTSGSTTKNTPIELTFTLSEVPTGFEYADISVTNGTLTAFTGSDTVYTATFTPDESGVSGKTECSIYVPADKFTDAVGNSNTASNTFAFTFDNTKPTITIESTTVTSGSTTKNTPILLTFTLSEVPTGFEYADISVTNGTLTAFTGSDTVYTATFTPDESDETGKTQCSISVPAVKFIDAVGNSNTASNIFAFTFDNTKPTITIESTTVTSGSTTKNTPIELTFTLSEVPTGFEYADISVTNGTLSPLDGGGTVYTATFTPDENGVSGKTECSISVPADKFTDAVGNYNTASNTFNFTFDNTKPGMFITATAGGSAVTSGSTTKNTPIELTFTLSEAITGFEYADISFTGGTLSPLDGDGTVYTATFTPDENGVSGKTECSISVPADKFIDAVGNNNTAAPTFNFTFDNTKPVMMITATASGSAVTSGSTTKNTPIELTFTLSEAITGFEYADISFTGGTLSPLAGGGSVYTATFTPDENGESGKTECSISVPADKFIDAVGNNNTAAPTFNFTFDNTKPGMMITATASGSAVTSGSTTKNTPIALTFTATEAITGFEYADISVTGGTLSPLDGDGTVYTATFTPDENGVSGKTECSISVPAVKFMDAVGNYNTDSNTFIFTFDNTKPTITIESTTVTSGSTTKNTPIELTFTLSEVPTGFEYADISVTNGSLTALTGSDTVYYATFTPDENGVTGKTECSISVPEVKFVDAVGNSNTASNTFAFTFDNTKPNITIASTTITSGSTTNNSSIELTFTLSEVPTGFEYSDISVTNGALGTLTTSDNMVYYATFTPDENGATGKTECSISVPADKFTDSVGNSNTASNAFTFTFDNTKPTIIIESTTVTSGSTTKNASIELTFTLTEVPTGFEYADINVTNGTLGTLTTQNNDNNVYYATFTPDENGATGKTECSIFVPADKFTDAVGNSNTASNAFIFTFDNTKPTITIESTTVTSGSTTKNTPILLTFTLSELPTGFEYADIIVTNGELGTLTTSDNMVYYATFTPDESGVTGKTECLISVQADKFTDAVGNYNTASNIFAFTFDNTKPTITIESTTVTSGSTTKNTPILLTFTLSEVPTGFEYADISFNGGTLSPLAGGGSVYTATFTPDENGVSGKTECSISVPADKFTDAVGNYNTASNPFTFSFDITNPTITIESTTITSGSTTKNTPILLTFTLSEVPTGFEYSDISVTNGALTELTGSDTVYYATFTPDENGVSGKTECSISVPAVKFIDAVGNSNTASNTFNFTFDNTKPTITIESTTVTSGSTTKNTPIELTFTLSEVPTGFEYADISVTNGSLTALTGSDTVYYATFTPDENGVSGKTECSISVPADKFTDSVGNYNTASNTFAFTFDNTKPTIIIESTTITSGSTTKNTSIELTFTLTEVPTGFEYADISVTNGTLSALSGSDTVYTATFTPDESGESGKTECSISVPADKFIDAVGNSNTASNTFTFTFDSVRPTMNITAIASGLPLANNGTTKNTSIELTFTLTEVPTGFEYADISVTNGTLGTLTTQNNDNKVYYATFTPVENGATGKTECLISVPADKFTDAVGNYNTASNIFAFTFDNTKPTIAIESTTVTSGSTTKNTPILLTFTLTEVPTGFEYADISFTNGTLGTLTTQNNDNTVYYATFTPAESDESGKTECSISVPADKFTDAVGNYNTASNTFAFTFDNTKPAISIASTTVTSGSTTKNTSIELTFTLSEVPTGFEYSDISFTNGTLGTLTNTDNKVYYATFTPDENGVTGKTECSISVPAYKFIDSVGNSNTASNNSTPFTFTFDNTKPTITIASTTVTSGSITKNTPILLTFTLSEVPTGFEYADISVTNGELGTLTTQPNDNTVYYATFTPDENGVTGKTECSISVPADKFTDYVGNYNTASNTFNFTFDNTKPTITIASTTIASGSTTKNASIELTFTLSEVPTGFDYADISVINGTLTALTGSDTVYTATFTPDENDVTGKTECSISVPADKFTDSVGNSNTASNTFTFTFDNTKPTITIESTTVTSGSTTKNTPILLTFTLSEVPTGFEYSDIIVTNGALGNLTTSDNMVYYATFTPDENDESGKTECSISVPEVKFIDAVGNYNTASNTFAFTFDNTKPTITIESTTVTSGSTANNASIALTFTSTEATTNFFKEDITVTNGTISAFTGSGTGYTATFTPQNQGACTIDVAAGAYTDAAGNSNNAANTFNWTFDNVSPRMTIASITDGVISGSTTNNETIALTFTSTKATNNFEEGDIHVTNGALSNFLASSATVYTATFTPTDQGVCTIDVAAGAFTDAVGNSNAAATTFNWTFDSVPPDMTITSTTDGVTSGSITNNASIALTFTSTEATTNFAVGDITVTNGTLTNFAGIGTDGSVYTATFTPAGQGACTIDVAAGAYTDAATNINNLAPQFTWTFDSVQPDITITSTTVTSGSITDDATIELTFTSTKATTNFVVGNITVANGVLTNFAGIGTDGAVYTATFTPTGTGACTIDVAAGAYTDAAGNSNNAATRFNWTFARNVSFDTNTLTIVNSIDANVTDTVLFVLPYGEEMSNINVTAFTGTGTITYDLSTDGESVRRGTFSGRGTNLLGTNALIASTNTTFTGRGTNLRGTNVLIEPTNTTYILTLSANTSISYTIVGTKIVNYGNVTPTALSFVNNKLTIQNSINSADVDRVSFDINAGSLFDSLVVTSLLNRNRISYVLDISGGSTVSSGSFIQAGFNMLTRDLPEQPTNTTYILTLTSVGTNTYSIVGRSRNDQRFDIDKFCTRNQIPCNNVGYNRLVTSTNNPSVSNKMRYSQLLRSRRFKPIQKIGTSVPPPKPEIPLYLFATGQIFAQSVFR
jgi:hypothetical protein